MNYLKTYLKGLGKIVSLCVPTGLLVLEVMYFLSDSDKLLPSFVRTILHYVNWGLVILAVLVIPYAVGALDEDDFNRIHDAV